MRASAFALLRGDALTAESCDGETVGLPAGPARVVLGGSGAFAPVDLVLLATTSRPAPRDLGDLWIASHNVNEGWRADGPEGPLRPITVDGWRQGWVGVGPPDQVRFGEVTWADSGPVSPSRRWRKRGAAQVGG